MKDKPQRKRAQRVSSNSNLLDFLKKFSSDEACLSYLEKRRWPKGPTCLHCGNSKKHITRHGGPKARRGLHTCGACRRQFTVTVGTIFEGSHLPLPKWFAAIYLMCSSKKGISACQLQRQLGITYKTAWFMCHRIRLAMRTQAFSRTLSGTVEADETYIGAPKHGKCGRGAKGKTIVFAMVERGGLVNAQVVPDVRKITLQHIIANTVEPGARLMTDDLRSYFDLSVDYDHGVVRHSKGYVAAGDVHTNSVESFFALLKRGIHGTFHHISQAKADMYCGEFGFRLNSNGLTDMERFDSVLTACDGRLKWNFREV